MKHVSMGALAGLFLISPLGSGAQTVAVDNEAGAPTYTETGTWQSTSNVTAGFNGGGYRLTRSTSPLSTATWRPGIPSTGFYEVSAVFRRGGDRSSAVPYQINHADGTASRVVDQTGAFSGELGTARLGVYRFTAGTDGSVVMSNAPGGNLVFIADAIVFTADEGPTVTQTRVAPLYPKANQPLLALARVEDNTTVASVQVHWSASPSSASGIATAFDNGFVDDGAAGDGLYGAALPGFAAGETVSFFFRAADNNGVSTDGPTVSVVVGTTGNFTLRINEIMASNAGSAFDEDFGDSGDWVELYNFGPDVADLTSHTLSDALGNPTKWRFPAGTAVAPDNYLLVWCDNNDVALNELHTNFALSASGEAVVLYNAEETTVVDQIVFPALGSDEAFARIPNGSGTFQKTILTTPRQPNLAGVRGPMPTFSHGSGLYSSPFTISISAPGATEIRYTTNGSEPTTASAVYTAPLSITATTGLRARAYYSSDNPSRTATASYLFDVVANRTIPVMNVVMDPADLFDPTRGIYVNFHARGENWERTAHVVFMNADGTSVTEAPVGIRINGGSSRALAKKSFRIALRNAYGQGSWTLPYLERTTAASFNNLVLRGNNNDGILNASLAQLNQVTFFRDQMIRHWHEDTGAIGVDGFFCALYLNGQYWGLYNACERVTDDYMEAKVGGADWDVVKGTWNSTIKYHTEALDGDLVAWQQFMAWLDSSDLSTDAGLNELKQRIDYHGFLRYFAFNIALQNEDWPMNNWIATRRRGQAGARWIFHENDAEWAMGLRPQGWSSDTILWAQGANFMLSPGHNNTIAPLSKLFNGNDLQTNRTSNINGILDHPQGRRDFIAAMEEILNFELHLDTATASINSYANRIQTEVPRESARWAPNMITSAAAFNSQWPIAVNNLRTFVANRPEFVRQLMTSKFSLGGTRTITFNASGSGNGRLRIYGRTVDLPWTGTFFAGSDLTLVAQPQFGSAFTGWTGAVTAPTEVLNYGVTSGSPISITLNFGPGPIPPQPNDVIFNEYWINDNGTSYSTVGGPILNDWFELLVVRHGTDMRGWRVTNNGTKSERSTIDNGSGSLIFPNIPALANLPAGTIILVVASTNATNAATFPQDDLDPSDGRLIFYRGNGNLNDTTDVGFGMGTSNEALNLLAPGPTDSFDDDIGIDFIAEGSTVTPLSFYGNAGGIPVFAPPFAGIGNDDGAIFTNSAGLGFNNDDGTDLDTTDALPGPGGWIVDPPAAFTGDTVGAINILTPGAVNTGQDLSTLLPSRVEGWELY